MTKSHSPIYEFGAFRLDARERQLLREGIAISLPPRIFDTLVVLIRHRGHLITKDELLREVWPDSFVEEGNLTVNISALRKVLGERDNGYRFIETVPKRGYRFVMPVRELTADHELLIARRATAHVTIKEEQTETRPLEEAATQGLRLIRRSLVSARFRMGASIFALVFVATVVTVYWLGERNTHSHANTMFAEGEVGQAFVFNGTSDFISVPNSPALNLTSSFTVEAWINPTTLNNDPIILEKGTKVDNRVGLQVLANGTLCGSFDIGDCSVATAPGVVSDGRFTHVAFALDLATHQARLYINGALVGTNVAIRGAAPNSDNLLIGDSGAVAKRGFSGLIDEVSIYNRALSNSEIAAIANAAKAGKCLNDSPRGCVAPPGGLVAWYSGDGDANDRIEGNNGVRPNLAEEQVRLRNAFEMIDNGVMVEEAIPLVRNILRTNPNSAMAHWCLSEAYRYGGMIDASVAEGERALQLDPQVSRDTNFNAYLYAGEYEKFVGSTMRQAESARTNFYRGLGYLYLNQKERAVAEFDRAYELDPTYSQAQIGQALKAALKGDRQSTIGFLRSFEQEPGNDGELLYKVAQAYALLGDKQPSLHMLRLSIERKFYCYSYFIQDPLLDCLHRNPEFEQLMEEARRGHEEFKQKFF